MNKIEFLERLEARLRGINVVDRVRSLDYFSEMIDDCMENGMSEDDAVAALGDLDEIAKRIVQEAPESPLRGERPFDGGEKTESSAPVDGGFTAIRVRVRESEVNILRSEDGESRVDCVDQACVYHRVFTDGGVLNVETVDERRWYERIKTLKTSLKVNIYLPEGKYDSLGVETMSGAVRTEHGLVFEKVSIQTMSGAIGFFSGVQNLLELHSMSGSIRAEGDNTLSYVNSATKSGNVELCGFNCRDNVLASSTSGIVRLCNIKGRNCAAKTASGSVSLKNAFAVCRLSAATASGSIRLDGCDANRVELDSASGSIRGSLMSGKQFSARSISGSISLPKDCPDANGECRANTVSGSIAITISE